MRLHTAAVPRLFPLLMIASLQMPLLLAEAQKLILSMAVSIPNSFYNKAVRVVAKLDTVTASGRPATSVGGVVLVKEVVWQSSAYLL